MGIDPNAALTRAPEILEARIGEHSIALLSTETSCYYGLEGPGARIWELLATPVSVAELCERLQAEYEVAPEICLADTLSVLEDMKSHGLIRELDADPR